jgi:hypothetical protein
VINSKAKNKQQYKKNNKYIAKIWKGENNVSNN